MVAPLNPHSLDYEPKPCLARPMLHAALLDYDAGRTIEAALKLREAVKRFIIAAAEWYGCIPQVKQRRVKFLTPREYVRAIRKAGHCDKWGAEILMECIELGNLAAHCRPFDPKSVNGCIGLLFNLMDKEPYTYDAVRFPVVVEETCPDDDDHDPADWWKREGGAQ